jgi:hypothetical protein
VNDATDGTLLATLGRTAQEIGAARADAGYAGAFHILARAAAEMIGYRMFTVLLYHPESGAMERLFTAANFDRSAVYPVGGRKPRRKDHWSETVIDRGEVLIVPDAVSLKATFADHEELFAIGCEAAMCLPVREAGRPLGTVNLLDTAQHFSERHAAIGRVLAGLAVPLFLRAKSGEKQ